MSQTLETARWLRVHEQHSGCWRGVDHTSCLRDCLVAILFPNLQAIFSGILPTDQCSERGEWNAKIDEHSFICSILNFHFVLVPTNALDQITLGSTKHELAPQSYADRSFPHPLPVAVPPGESPHPQSNQKALRTVGTARYLHCFHFELTSTTSLCSVFCVRDWEYYLARIPSRTPGGECLENEIKQHLYSAGTRAGTECSHDAGPTR
jgi:hypothetical protein